MKTLMLRTAAAGLLGLLAACAQPGIQFEASKKSPLELRSAQTRLIAGDQDAVMRGVVATLHDLGYRITKVEVGAGTVSATRQTTLRMAVVVSPRSAQESVVRANATIVALRREAQVDSPVFYARNFFDPLGAALQRDVIAVPEEAAVPDALMPVAERNTARERAAAAAPATGGNAASTTGSSTR